MPASKQTTDAKLARRQMQDKLAAEVIEECRSQLMLKFRFLDLALWRMKLEPLRADMRYPLACDGKKVYYDPLRVLARFSASFEETIRDYLHLTMHCIFRQPFDEDHPHKQAWWLTCDIITEAAVMDMCQDRFVCEGDKDRRAYIDELVMELGALTPGKLYSFMKMAVSAPRGSSYRGFDASKIADLHALFERDNHESWPGNANEDAPDETPGDNEELGQDQGDDKNLESGGDVMDELSDELKDQVKRTLNAQTAQDDDDGQDSGQDDDSDEARTQGEDISQSTGEDDAGGNESAPQDDPTSERDRQEDVQAQKDWEELAKQIEMDIQTFNNEWGDEAGTLIASLRIANRKRYDYTAFLRQFMTVNEEMKVNQDEFDYIYYTFGMDMYGNMPFIEPLEYKEDRRMRDLVIVIDTSESVSGPLVKRFLEHTFAILKQMDTFTRKVRIFVVQCDSKVQAVQFISDLSQVDSLMERFHIRGFGGTDFRPAFSYVQTLRDAGSLRDMKGLIYFTDGLGHFPSKAPDYDVAFVFMDDGDRVLPPVPPWAIKVVIDEENIRQLKDNA